MKRTRRTRTVFLGWTGIALLALLLVAACGTEQPAATATPTAQPAPGATPTPDPGPGTQPPAPSFDAEAHFRGQTVRFITSSQPGGGADVALRYWASQWPRYIPGSPRMAVSNIAPHVTGKNFLWNSRPDGYTIGLFSTSMLREQPLPAAEFISSDFQYVGDVGDRTGIWTITGASGYTSIEELMGSSGPPLRYLDRIPSAEDMEDQAFQFMLISHWLDIPFRFGVIPERGIDIWLLEVERGNMDTFQGGGGRYFQLPITRPGWFAEGILRPVVDMTPFARALANAELRQEDIDALPHIYDLLTEEQAAIWQGMFHAATAMARPFVLPPNTPPEIVATYRQAFADALTDPTFVEDYVRISGVPATFIHGDDLQQEAIQSEQTFMQWANLQAELRVEMYDRFMR